MEKILSTILLIVCVIYARADVLRQKMSLEGQWNMLCGSTSEVVTLPGTTETNSVGPLSFNDKETTHLSRVRPIEAQVKYSRDVVIPKSWSKKLIMLKLERTKPTHVYVDGVEVGESDNISTSQQFDLTAVLTPGTHQLTILVDNTREAVPHQIVENSHAYSDDTQTNWNGIIGEISLEAVNPVHITDLRIDADSIYISTSAVATVNISINGAKIASPTVDGYQSIAYDSSNLERWSEFHPTTYTLNAEIKGKDAVEKIFGLCDFRANGTQFMVNGKRTFLRGKHDACVFPLTGHAPMKIADWQRYFSICKSYGINHVRFHSWCPPEAAFAAADIEGIYLQPELPFWGDFNLDDKHLMSFLLKEGENILKEYGHHPSFVMMALGNELWGDIPTMESFVIDFKFINPKILYTFGSNYYLGYKGIHDTMDYFTTCRNGGEAWGEYNTHTRGSFSFADAADGGILNHFSPNSIMTLETGIAGCPIPIISHETGQFQTYPDYNEINKYTGVLHPFNMEVFKERLEKAGMASQAEDFHKASGLWSVQLYKAEIELDMRTRGLAGYQLLDIQDYPGQGSAYVGILDAFMDSKGITTPNEWRQWCSPVVPLLSAPKFCYSSNEKLKANVLLANYTESPIENKTLNWNLGSISGKIDMPYDSIGLSELGNVEIDLSKFDRPTKLNFSMRIEGTNYGNTYPIWIYPSRCTIDTTGILVTNKLTSQIAEKLKNGASVLLLADGSQYADNTIDGLFTTDYWNYRMFKTISTNNNKPVSPGTLGILTAPRHSIFNYFPTDMHTSWQWFNIIKKSHPMILDGFPEGFTPIIQVIDNVERNHKLGLAFELTVGNGKLFVVMSPLNKMQNHIEAKWLYCSILRYMKTDFFRPKCRITLARLNALFNAKATDQNIDTLNNISY